MSSLHRRHSHRRTKRGANKSGVSSSRAHTATGQLFFVLRLSQAAGSKQIFKVYTSTDDAMICIETSFSSSLSLSLLPVFSLLSPSSLPLKPLSLSTCLCIHKAFCMDRVRTHRRDKWRRQAVHTIHLMHSLHTLCT